MTYIQYSQSSLERIKPHALIKNSKSKFSQKKPTTKKLLSKAVVSAVAI